jgi:hypothetical protein
MNAQRLISPPLGAEGLTPTGWSSPADKAAFANSLLAFVAHDFPATKWTQGLSKRLSLTFGMIAHYDRHGFRQAWFTTRADQAAFLAALLRWPCWGQPTHTFCDVERRTQARLREAHALEAYQALAAAETEARERAQLAALRARYEGIRATPAASLPILRPPRTGRRASDTAPRLL